MCRWGATHHWKALDKGYNFVLNLISIEGLHTKLWAPKVAGVLTLEVLGQKVIWMWASWRGIEYTIKGEGGGFPQVRAVVSLVSSNCPWLVLAPKVL
jgi:hypothetical protein